MQCKLSPDSPYKVEMVQNFALTAKPHLIMISNISLLEQW